ncbi:MAG: Addiction module toxin, RelE/StbE family [Candidatus Magasanikbacteria bacterium GW2011_GWC2_37_14]|uniref:Addiction module toxin, RelE/StbE family n=1 Tax=Candidatus Magasanikbacteria bacterium GW2011_GWC2_37_14 TaxID=1619046 RepID=A0A0G0GCP5_9BACT|nr:MAG: Addiction module toxin, RelE/StbE family [Candidatus Magasanikbacteria bacterium GW2011_GWC2_37_14]
MYYKLRYSSRFKRQYKKLCRSGQNRIVTELIKIMNFLADNKRLPEKNFVHKLSGEFEGFYECHIFPDWLLIYRVYEDILVLEFVATGTHAELFE